MPDTSITKDKVEEIKKKLKGKFQFDTNVVDEASDYGKLDTGDAFNLGGVKRKLVPSYNAYKEKIASSSLIPNSSPKQVPQTDIKTVVSPTTSLLTKIIGYINSHAARVNKVDRKELEDKAVMFQ